MKTTTPVTESSPPDEERALKRSKPEDETCRDKNHQRGRKNAGIHKPNNDEDGIKTLDELIAIWKEGEEGTEKVKAISEIFNIYGKELDWFLSAGIEAFHHCSTLDSELGQLKQQLQSKDDQLKTFQKIKEDQSKTIQSLINSQSTHQANILQQAESVTIRSNLRAELNAVTFERDQGLAQIAEHSRTIDLLQQDVRDLKIKFNRISQEKIKMEREYQSTQRLNWNQSNNDRVDSDYYKRKAAELNNRVQSLQISLSEKDRQLNELRHETTNRGVSGKRSL